MIRIITGDVHSDISRYAVSEMTEHATHHPDEKYIIIVPEQFTLNTQQRVVSLHPNHACMNIDVVSFDRLAHVVLAKLGKDISEVLDDIGKSLILKNVMNDIADDLHVYRSKIHFPGFIEEMKSLITEFMQYRVDDNMLYLMQTGAEGSFLEAKLQDIRLIYRRFNEEIADKYTTSEEVLDVFEKQVRYSDFLKSSHIYLDGFTGFTPIQFRIIRQMLSEAQDVTCTVVVPWDEIRPDVPEYDLFALACRTFYKLKDIAEEEQSGFEHLCADKDKVENTGNNETRICIKCLNDPEGEIRFAAGQILDLVRAGKCRFRDIALLTADMEGFYSYFSSVFEEAQIPAFIDHKERFSGNLLVRLILSALEVSVKGMVYETVFDYLKTGFTEITDDECALLENYVLEFNIRGRSRWESPFSANRELEKGRYAWDLERINEIRQKASAAITSFYGKTSSRPHAVTLFIKHLKTLLSQLGAEEKIASFASEFAQRGDLSLSKQYEQIYEQVIDLLDKIDMLMGQTSMTVKEFSGIVESGINEIKLGIIPPSLDAVTAGDLTRTRIGDIKYLFILGMNEGKIPSASGGSILFTQKERSSIRKDYEIAPTIQENLYIQRYYLYLAFNRPEKLLYLTYSASSVSGEQMSPSSVLEDLDELIPGRKKTIDPPSKGAVWKGQTYHLAAAQMRRQAEKGTFKGSDLLGFFAESEPELVRKLALSSVYSNEQTPLDKRVALDLYGEVLKGSVSRYETFYDCPYRHFLSYGMHLEKRPEYKVEAADLGTIYHEALENYSKELEKEGLTFRNVSDEDSHRIISSCVRQAVLNTAGDVLSSSARNEYLISRISQISEKTTDILRDHVRSGLFEPEEFEFTFDEPISDDVRFRGKIDRVDIYDGGDLFIKIIDYKSGSKKFSIKDIYAGVQLQLAAYMSSAVKAAREKYNGRNVRPGGLYYYLINDRYVRDQKELENKNRMSGVTLCEDQVIHAVDTTLGEEGRTKSNIVPVSLTQSGLAASSVIANAKEMDSLISFAGNKIREAGDRIKAGEIDLAPYKGDTSHNGCSFCDYKDICRFDAGSFGTDWRETDTDKAQMEDEVYGRS